MCERRADTWNLKIADSLGPVVQGDRIQSLDVLRGFALLGILVMNITGFGLVSAAYLNPQLGIESSTDFAVWAGMELFAEGSMRAIFSLLFGAGILLFLGDGDDPGSAMRYFKRILCLLMFGLFDAYVLLWTGDILVTYAIAGLILYFVRSSAGHTLLIAAATLTVLLSLYNAGVSAGLAELRSISEQASAISPQGRDVPPDLATGRDAWQNFARELHPPVAELEAELDRRRGSYAEAFIWSAGANSDVYRTTLLPVLLPDALVVMLLGMALYRYGILQGRREKLFYARLAGWGFGIGVAVNGFEVWRANASGFDLLTSINVLQPTYHLGRIALGLGWLGLVIYLNQAYGFGRRLAAVGRVALSNYLMQSLVGLFVFTGAGLGLVGEMVRYQLVFVAAAIGFAQLLISPWWLARFRYGPAEWLWRRVTYAGTPRKTHG